MRKIILFAIISLLIFQYACLSSENTYLIPEKINVILGAIKPNMPKEDLDKLIFKYYPNAKYYSGLWSGGTGYFSYHINDNLQLDIAGAMEVRDAFKSSKEKQWVHQDLTFYIFYKGEKRRIDIKEYKWE